MRQGDFPDFHAEFFELADGFPDGAFHARFHAGLEVFLWNAQPQAFDRFLQSFQVIRDRRGERSGIVRILPGDGLQDGCAVVGAACHRADRVEGGDQRDQTVAGDAPVGGFQSGHVAEAGRHADRAAGILAQGKERPCWLPRPRRSLRSSRPGRVPGPRDYAC